MPVLLAVPSTMTGAVAAGVADKREADAGVAGRPLNDDAARPEEAALLGILDDEERSRVLDRAPRVQKLGLAEDRASGLLGGAPQFDEGRITNRSDKAVADVHASLHPERFI